MSPQHLVLLEEGVGEVAAEVGSGSTLPIQSTLMGN